MSIASAALWRGSRPVVFTEELEASLVGAARLVHLDGAQMDLADARAASVVSDDGYFFDPVVTLVLDRAESLGAAGLKALTTTLRETSTAWHLVVVVRAGAVPAAITALNPTVFDRRIEAKAAPMAAFAVAHLASRGIEMPAAVASRLAEHAGEDVDALVETVTTLAQVAVVGQHLTWEQVLALAPGAGVVPVYLLSSALDRGDAGAALAVLGRLEGALHPLQVCAFLVKRYRSMAAVCGAGLSPAQGSELLGTSPGAARFVLAASARLGREKVVACLGLIGAAERDLKGGSRMDAAMVLEMLVLALAAQTALPSPAPAGARA